MSTSERRVWKFGDDVNTDLIIPGRYLDNYDPAHLAAHAMEGISREFSSRVSEGDVIVAGRNFGCGSSREQAVIALKRAGVGAIVARSYARIFYRNAVNLGLPIYVSEGAHGSLNDGDVVRLDNDQGHIVSADGRRLAQFEPMPERLRAITEAGGLVPYLRERIHSDEKTCR